MREAAILNVIGGADRGRQYELVLPETRIGRGADQDLVLADIAVSRRHITVHAESGRFRLRDLGSGNGTLVNGQRIDTVILNDGDQIELGNTLMRFEHAASRNAVPGGPSYAPPPPAAAPAPAPYPAPSSPAVYTGSAQYGSAPATAAPMAPYAGDQGYTPSDAVERPGASAAGGSLPPFLMALASPSVRLATLGTMGGLIVIALVVIIAKTATAKPQVVPSEAEELYHNGLKLFAAKDYEGAKVNFNEALAAAPDSPEAKRYVAQCDAEVHAGHAMQTAERALANGRYAEAMKSLDAVDSMSLLHDEAMKLRKENAPRAAQQEAEEASTLTQDETDTAKMKVVHALSLDPFNPKARQLAAALHIEVQPLPAGAVPPPAPPTPAPAPTPAPVAVAPAPKRTHAVKEDSDLAPVKAKPGHDAAKVDAPSSQAALAAYRNHDFATAERLYRLEGSKQSPKQGDKTIAFANQVRDLKQLADKAASDENKSPAQAVKEYEDAVALDAKIGRGANAAYFKQRMGRLQLPIAQQAFAAGKYDQAFLAAQQAQKLGASDGGMMAKLEAKAQELTNKGVALQKSNLSQAKQYWRQVMKMVPTGSPTYNKAYTLVNNTGGPHRDEDED
jgi:tetratricopeptide (TPR) repeat protein